MKNRFFILVLFLFGFHFSKAQSSLTVETLKSYEIKADAISVGKLFLAQKKDHTYNGYISFTFNKGKIGRSRIGKFLAQIGKEKEKEPIIVKNVLSDSLVASLMLKLQQAGIEQLVPCEEDVECAKHRFLDPNFTVIKLVTEEKSKQFDYASIALPTAKYIEETPLRKKVQDLMVICAAEIDYHKQFIVAEKELKRGWYFMYADQGYLVFKKRKDF